MLKEHLAILRTGVEGWNSWRLANPEVLPDLSNAKLIGFDLTGFDLRGTNLIGATLTNAKIINVKLGVASLPNPQEPSSLRRVVSDLSRINLRGAEIRNSDLSDCLLLDANLTLCSGGSIDFSRSILEGANCWRAQLTHCSFQSAKCTYASFSGADVSKSDFRECSLEYTNFAMASLVDADFRDAVFSNAKMTGADLSDANISGATGIVFDGNRLQNTQIARGATDPWSMLKRRYTGHRLVLNVLLLLAFLLPYIARASFWLSVNSIQEIDVRMEPLAQLLPDSLRSALPNNIDLVDGMRQSGWSPYRVFQLLVGLDQGPLHALMAFSIVLYNILRAILTFQIGALYDEERRSMHSPNIADYKILLRLNKVVSALMILAIVSFTWHVMTWLFTTVYLPPKP